MTIIVGQWYRVRGHSDAVYEEFRFKGSPSGLESQPPLRIKTELRQLYVQVKDIKLLPDGRKGMLLTSVYGNHWIMKGEGLDTLPEEFELWNGEGEPKPEPWRGDEKPLVPVAGET